MHRLTRWLLCWLLAASGALLPLGSSASVVLLSDPYGANATSCASSACDVIGEKEWFDLDKIELNVTSSLVHIKVYSNFINPTFAPYTFPGTTLQLGVGEARSPDVTEVRIADFLGVLVLAPDLLDLRLRVGLDGAFARGSPRSRRECHQPTLARHS